ncbi:MAG TPA: hypothetical protein VF666_08660 [Pyrinomonadaceae bacterium]|jgi:hypothetical protein
MQIIYKVKEGKVEEAKEIALKNIDEALPEPTIKEVSVRQVFPGLTTGQRARLFTIDLPSQLPDDNVTELIELLRKEDGIEYAELPAAKRPM